MIKSLVIKLDLEKIRLVVKNMELLVNILKEELSLSETVAQINNFPIDDYDEVFED